MSVWVKTAGKMGGFDPVSKIRTVIDTVWLCAASAALRPCLGKARAHSLEQVRNGEVHRLGKIQPVPLAHDEAPKSLIPHGVHGFFT